MYGDLGNKLILDAKRTSKLSEVPLYQTELVRDILKEISDLHKDAIYLVENQRIQDEGGMENEEEAKINQCQLFVTHLSMRRNKRCLLAYEKLRSQKINEFAWLNVDPVVDGIEDESSRSAAIDDMSTGSYTSKLSLDNLNHAEQEYFKNYQALLVDYKSTYADIDLSGSLDPPTNIFIDVRVLKDGGEVQTEYGVFNLIKDSQFYVRKSDVERLIQQGYLMEL